METLKEVLKVVSLCPKLTLTAKNTEETRPTGKPSNQLNEWSSTFSQGKSRLVWRRSWDWVLQERRLFTLTAVVIFQLVWVSQLTVRDGSEAFKLLECLKRRRKKVLSEMKWSFYILSFFDDKSFLVEVKYLPWILSPTTFNPAYFLQGPGISNLP